jgi:hypothetical protein
MGFKMYNYVGVFLGDFDGAIEEIERINMGPKMGMATSRDVLMLTFTSAIEPNGIKDYFDMDPRFDEYVYFIFDYEHSVSSFGKDVIREKMLSVFNMEPVVLHDMVGKISNKPDNEDDIDIDSMSQEEKDDIINKILGKSPDISEKERELLKKLTQDID